MDDSKHALAVCKSSARRGWYRDQCEANAKLIAAAPDLMDACTAARRALTFGKNVDWNIVCESLDAAIAKAEGGDA
jgi:hypothetical protein